MAGVDFNEEKDVREGGQEVEPGEPNQVTEPDPERDAALEGEKERAEASGGTSATPTELSGGAAGTVDPGTAGLGIPGGTVDN